VDIEADSKVASSKCAQQVRWQFESAISSFKEESAEQINIVHYGPCVIHHRASTKTSLVRPDLLGWQPQCTSIDSSSRVVTVILGQLPHC